MNQGWLWQHALPSKLRNKKTPGIHQGFDLNLENVRHLSLASLEAQVLIVDVEIEVISIDKLQGSADLIALTVLHLERTAIQLVVATDGHDVGAGAVDHFKAAIGIQIDNHRALVQGSRP